MPDVQVNGQTIFYETMGQGQPLLLMHGWTNVGRDLIDVARSLSADYRVILPDLPGYGRSVPPFRTYPDDFYVRDAQQMAGLLDALKLSKVHIMGFSDGGEVALLLPILRPDLCRTVIAWGAIGAFKPELCEHSRNGLPPTWLTNEIRAKHPGQNVDQWPYQWVDAFCAMVESGGDVSLSRASEIRCPLLLILGDQDQLNPVDDGQRFVAAVPKDKMLDVFAGVGHAVHEQRPEQFLASVQTFLRRY